MKKMDEDEYGNLHFAYLPPSALFFAFSLKDIVEKYRRSKEVTDEYGTLPCDSSFGRWTKVLSGEFPLRYQCALNNDVIMQQMCKSHWLI